MGDEDTVSPDGGTAPDDYFERELYLGREETAAMLRDVAGSLEAGTDLTVSGDGWEFPFSYREPIEIEVEYSPGPEAELELEFEFTAAEDADLSIE